MESNNEPGCLIAGISGILFFVGIFVFIEYPIQSIVVITLVIGIGIVVLREMGKEQTRKEEEKRTKSKEMKKELLGLYNNIKSKVSIPENVSKVSYKKGHANILTTTNYIWIENGDLCFFPANSAYTLKDTDVEKIALYKIPLNRIEYYDITGELIHENKISGGGGGGSSVGGAIAGGVIAGGAGAVIGSRKKNESISSKLVTHDDRETVINYLDDSGKKHSMFFDFEDYDTFNKLIPDKAYEIVSAIKTNKLISKSLQQDTDSNKIEKIRELAKLRDEGILDEEEFSAMKKQFIR